jgi:hypothetical protein
MRPYTPDTSKGRKVARDDIHHKTQDKHGNRTREPSAKRTSDEHPTTAAGLHIAREIRALPQLGEGERG